MHSLLVITAIKASAGSLQCY